MDAELLRALTSATIASSLAILLVRLLRKPLRAAAGARAAYWLWLLVPAVALAASIPAPPDVFYATSFSLPQQVGLAVSNFTTAAEIPATSSANAAALAIWAGGAAAMFVLLLRRQILFVRSLGALLPDENGFWRSATVVSPLLVGAWRPRIVVPRDFEARYTPEERDLVLAHERAHLSRRDAAVNAIATGWLCLFWFNPLIYWAIGWLRIDQELACDALVLARRQDFRRCYANALLKTQLAAESGWRVPVGCPWHSNHSLKERIVMLKRPLPGTFRRAIGIAVITGMTVSGSYAAWAGQSTAESRGPEILVDMRAKISNSKTKEILTIATRYVVHSGELPSDMQDSGSPFACTPILPDELAQSPAPESIKARGLPLPGAGQVLLDCVIRQDREVIATPAVMAAEGKTATIETTDREGVRLIKIKVSATTSEELVAEAKKATAKR